MTKDTHSRIARGSAEIAILSLLSRQSLYGFEIAKRIEVESGGVLKFNLASLYPMLYELEKREWVEGRWEKNAAGRDRRYYSLTPKGKGHLEPLRREWQIFFQGLDRLVGVKNA
jgi:PadR family transcriptional regulator, regulatory protein PadR